MFIIFTMYRLFLGLSYSKFLVRLLGSRSLGAAARVVGARHAPREHRAPASSDQGETGAAFFMLLGRGGMLQTAAGSAVDRGLWRDSVSLRQGGNGIYGDERSITVRLWAPWPSWQPLLVLYFSDIARFVLTRNAHVTASTVAASNYTKKKILQLPFRASDKPIAFLIIY